jgi:glycosyltransferase involved in cell wall biosynthesis
MTLSLCICTMNRPDDLRRALDSIGAGILPHQVIVSNDGAQQPTMNIVADYPWATYQDGPHRGLSANRNACLRVVTGSHVAFIDDDVTVPVEFVPAAEACSREAGQGVIATGHEIRHMEGLSAKVTPHNADRLGFQRTAPSGALHGLVINATVFPESLFHRAQFDERLKYGYEEIDMARHAVRLGYTVRYFDSLWVDHHPSPINRASYARLLTSSRLYSTMKAHVFYERSVRKSCAYAAVAPLHAVAGAVVHRRPLGDELRGIGRAMKGIYGEARERRDPSKINPSGKPRGD